MYVNRVATVRKKSGKTRIFQSQGKVTEFCKKSLKSQGIIFSFRKACFKVIDFDTLQVMRAGTVVLACSFCSFLIIHQVHSRSVKIVQRSGKSQGTLSILMSGNPV